MEKTKRGEKVGLMVRLVTLMATPAFARSISLKEAGLVLRQSCSSRKKRRLKRKSLSIVMASFGIAYGGG